MNLSILNPSHLAYAAQRLAGIFLMALLSLPTLSWAHSNEYLATIKGAHGGMLRMAEMYHFELVVKDGEALLGKRQSELENGKWALPSGYIEYEEDFISAGIREEARDLSRFLEASNVDVQIR